MLALLGPLLSLALIVPALAEPVPLPRPRPAAAPQPAPPAAAEAPSDKAGEPRPEQPAAAAESRPAAPAASPCRLALTEQVAVAPSIPPIRGPGACGGEDLVRLEAVVLPDGGKVAVKPAAVLRCEMASAVASWVRDDVTAIAGSLGSKVVELDNFDSFECRGRNRVAGAKLSEHGRANAIDVRGLRLADGRFVSLTERSESRPLREAVLQSVCARFDTVLGPGSDWYHEDHIHLDLASRRGGYKICQWGVYDPLPAQIALLPAARPEEAPPRPGDAADGRPRDAGAPAAAEEAGGEQAAEEPAPAPKPARRSAQRRTR